MQAAFTTALLRWFAQYGRELPWRGISDPYGIWVSEIILQQTRIEQGRDYWLRFMERFPTVEALAAASEDEVLRQWQGLGYYSRARNMHAAARQIVEQGGFPRSIEGLRALKGVGDYTAAAVGSMAFGLPAAAVDGNVYRVLSRHYGIDVPINTTQGKHTFQAMAQELLPEGEASAFNQAMMDFGATWCTPRSPRCMDCPVADTCDALRTGRVDQLPVKEKKLTASKHSCGYRTVALTRNGKTEQQYIHRIVAEAYIPNPQNLPWINHKDEDKANNFVGNLEWCTPLYNNTYNEKNIKHSEKLKGRSFTDEHKERIRQSNLGKHGQQRKVICVDDGTVFGSYNEAGKHYGISPMTVKSCCERKSKGKVRTFRYADDFCSYGEREGE